MYVSVSISSVLCKYWNPSIDIWITFFKQWFLCILTHTHTHIVSVISNVVNYLIYSSFCLIPCFGIDKKYIFTSKLAHFYLRYFSLLLWFPKPFLHILLIRQILKSVTSRFLRYTFLTTCGRTTYILYFIFIIEVLVRNWWSQGRDLTTISMFPAVLQAHAGF